MKVRFMMVPVTALVGLAAVVSCDGGPVPCEVYVMAGDSVLAHDSSGATEECVGIVQLDSAGGDSTPTYTVNSVQAADSAGGDGTPGR